MKRIKLFVPFSTIVDEYFQHARGNNFELLYFQSLRRHKSVLALWIE